MSSLLVNHNKMQDGKKFHAVRLRQRMKEQQQERVARQEQQGQQQLQTMTEEAPPPLTIAVTMSEDEYEHDNNDNYNYAGSPDPKDVSAWALMEHYPNQLEDQQDQQLQLQQLPQSDPILEMYTFQSSDSETEASVGSNDNDNDKQSHHPYQYRGKRLTPAQQEIFVRDPHPQDHPQDHHQHQEDSDSEPEPVVDTTLELELEHNQARMDTLLLARRRRRRIPNTSTTSSNSGTTSRSMMEEEDLEWHSNPHGEMTPSARTAKEEELTYSHQNEDHRQHQNEDSSSIRQDDDDDDDELSNIDDASSAHHHHHHQRMSSFSAMSPAGRHATSYSYTQPEPEHGTNPDLDLDLDLDLLTSNPDQEQDLSGEQFVGTQDEYFANPLVTSIYGGGPPNPTPARVRTQWQEEKKFQHETHVDDEDESAPNSILQESMIPSHHANDNMTQLSMASSWQLSEAGVYEPNPAPKTPLPPTTTTTTGAGDGSGTQEQQQQFAYLARIGELEATLQVQQLSQDSNQSKMQQRVVELEQALKVTAATPRGTLVENPLHTLLQRNQTLVKEVRFADQTCVELGTKNSALQAQVQILKEQLSNSNQETNELKRELVQANDKNHNDSGSSHSHSKSNSNHQVQQLQQELQDTKALLEETNATFVSGDAIKSVLRDLKQEVGALERESLLPLPLPLEVTQLSQDTFMNDTDTHDQDQDYNPDASYSSHCLAKALHLQVQRLRHKAQAAETARIHTSVQLQAAQTTHQTMVQRIHALEHQLQERDDDDGNDEDDDDDDNNHQARITRQQQLVQAQAENDFLGRQLGNAQEKLEQARHLIQSLQQPQQQQQQQPPHDPTTTITTTPSPRLQAADKRAFRLEKELAHAQASCVAMKRESERLLSQANATSFPVSSNGTDSDLNSTTKSQSQTEVMKLMQVALRRMMDQYQHLEHQVTTATDQYAERLAKMADTVSYLRSALVFDNDDNDNSVATLVQDQDASASRHTATPNQNTNHLTLHSSCCEEDDEMYRLMEEARSPPSIKYGDCDETSSDMGDVSRLFSDDGTLVSVPQRVIPDNNKWKEPLEAALRDCQRVREQMQSVQRTFSDERQRLEAERTRLRHTIEQMSETQAQMSVEALHKAEETGLVEAALAEAQENIGELQSLLASTVSERDEALEDTEEKTEQLHHLEQEKAQIEQTLGQAIEENSSLERQLETSQKERDELSAKSKVVSASLQEAQQESSDLSDQLRNQEIELGQRHQQEMDLLRQALRQAESELEQAKHLQESSSSKLSLALDEKSKLESMVADLLSSRHEFFSQTEDKVLEAEYKLEDMRKERSELKSRLSRVEKELASAKESFTSYKNRVKERLDDRESVIAALQSERSQAYECVQEMVLLRRDLLESLQSAQVCPDVVRRIQSQDQSSFDDGSSLGAKELEYWKQVIPAVGSSMQELSRAQSQLEDAERDTEQMTEDLARLESAEEDYQKQVEDERQRNEKLFALLRQAETEMERSVAQIRDMSSALVSIQAREAEAKDQARLMQEEWCAQKTELESSLETGSTEKGEMQSRLSDMEVTLKTTQGSLLETTERLSSTEEELSKVNTALQSKNSEEAKLRSKSEGLETKCTRLREYIRKLTSKCEEWEASYDRQSMVLDKLHTRNGKSKQKAAELAHRYKKLAGDIQRKSKIHNEDRAKWTQERSTLQQVHTQLEEELEVIAKELFNIDVAFS